MISSIVIAKKEILELRRGWLFPLLMSFLSLATILSVWVASQSFGAQLDSYNAYVAQLTASGSSILPAPPQLFPLQLNRGGVEYLEVLGALFAIVLGYGSIAKEKHRGTLQLLLTRPIVGFSIAGGKLGGLALVWFVVVVVLTALSLISFVTIGHASLAAVDFQRTAIFAITAWVYLIFWTALTMGITALARRLTTGLVVSIVVWLSFVLVIPQIGDTMDPDNQVPGGLFSTLQIQKADELAVLAQFAGFDAIRNGLEVSSITKHFERISFAFLGIKDKYNQQTLDFVFTDMWPYILTLVCATAAAIIFSLLATSRNNLQRKSL